MALTVEDGLGIVDLVDRYDPAADEMYVEAMLGEYAGDAVIGDFYSTGEGK